MVDVRIAGPRRGNDERILNEWKSDISTSAVPAKKGPRTAEYDKKKGSLSDIKMSLCVFSDVRSLYLTPNPPVVNGYLLGMVRKSFSNFQHCAIVVVSLQ